MKKTKQNKKPHTQKKPQKPKGKLMQISFLQVWRQNNCTGLERQRRNMTHEAVPEDSVKGSTEL